MQMVVYASPDWTAPANGPMSSGDRVQVLTGSVDALPAQVLGLQPEVLLVVGFADTSALLAALEPVCSHLARTAVLVVHPAPAPEFLLRLMQIGVREVLADDPAQWAGAFERVRARSQVLQQVAAPAVQATRIGFMSAKGGDGSTSLAVNMAAALAGEGGQRVLLIDLSLPFGDADISISSQAVEHDLADFCSEVQRLDDALLTSMVARLGPHLDFIASPAEFEKVIGLEPMAVQKLLEFVSSRYGFILMDLGSHVDPIILRVWEQLDQAVVVATANVASLRRFNRLRQLWENLGQRSSSLQVALNRLSAKPDVDIQAFARLCPDQPLRKLPVEDDGMKASLMQGAPLVRLQPRSGYARAVAAWANEWSGSPRKEKSLWQRLRKK